MSLVVERLWDLGEGHRPWGQTQSCKDTDLGVKHSLVPSPTGCILLHALGQVT